MICKCKLTTPKSRDVTRLTFRLPVADDASSVMFQILTCLSIPPVTMHPGMCGLTSRAEVAPSCAERVKRAGAGLDTSVGRVRASKLSTRPFSSDTWRGLGKEGGGMDGTYVESVVFPWIPSKRFDVASYGGADTSCWCAGIKSSDCSIVAAR